MRRSLLPLLLSSLPLLPSLAQTTCETDNLSDKSLWTQVGSTVSVTNGKIHFQESPGSTDDRVFRSVPVHDLWKLEFSFVPTAYPASAGAAHVLMAYTLGSAQPETSTNQQVRVLFLSDPYGSNPRFFVDATYSAGAQTISHNGSSIYYIRLERICETGLRLSVFLDAAMTQHAPGSPVHHPLAASIKGFNTLQVSTSLVASSNRYLTGDIDNIKLCGTTGATSTCQVSIVGNKAWTQVGSTITAQNGKVFYNNTSDGTDRRVYTSVPTYDLWKAEFKFTATDYTESSGPAHVLLGYTLGTAHTETSTNQQARILFLSQPYGSDPKFYVDATNSGSTSPGILSSKGVPHYIRLERTCPTQLVLSVFLDAARTKHAPNSPQTQFIAETVKGFNTFQVANSIVGSSNRDLTAVLDSFALCGYSQDPGVITALPEAGDLFEAESENAQLLVYNVLGQLQMEQASIQTAELPHYLSRLENGLYVVELVSTQGRKRYKILHTK